MPFLINVDRAQYMPVDSFVEWLGDRKIEEFINQVDSDDYTNLKTKFGNNYFDYSNDAASMALLELVMFHTNFISGGLVGRYQVGDKLMVRPNWGFYQLDWLQIPYLGNSLDIRLSKSSSIDPVCIFWNARKNVGCKLQIFPSQVQRIFGQLDNFYIQFDNYQIYFGQNGIIEVNPFKFDPRSFFTSSLDYCDVKKSLDFWNRFKKPVKIYIDRNILP